MINLEDISTRITLGGGLAINAMFLYFILSFLWNKYSQDKKEKSQK